MVPTELLECGREMKGECYEKRKGHFYPVGFDVGVPRGSKRQLPGERSEQKRSAWVSGMCT